MTQHTFDILTGDEITNAIDEIARLRIDIFAEYPYLYGGCVSYEVEYLRKFANTKQSFMVVMKDQGKIVGGLTGLPLAHEQPAVRRPFVNSMYPLASTFYFSEVLMYPRYRGNGYATTMFKLAEQFVSQLCSYNYIALATVIREANHLKRPHSYQPLDGMWQHFGYKPLANHICIMDWREHGDEQETAKPLMFWIKSMTSMGSSKGLFPAATLLMSVVG
ncbi:GNAT family N-acetyltransferase [Pseudoalteromonas sp. MMG012]|uniref:GNAT family N-acetyltransferase n=1 Tax=Pseudoalteromonas sp. MMG012 TaxID=2822686 RepID=UPI001B3A5353|nr:GNAT family N-acetyltransferase [Pseudoalteromonas sp. MMG012]MBQ4850168.1 GNAT family N-acetyltransferase [Pseudoalteromonas sp. MMG012]